MTVLVIVAALAERVANARGPVGFPPQNPAIFHLGP